MQEILTKLIQWPIQLVRPNLSHYSWGNELQSPNYCLTLETPLLKPDSSVNTCLPTSKDETLKMTLGDSSVVQMDRRMDSQTDLHSVSLTDELLDLDWAISTDKQWVHDLERKLEQRLLVRILDEMEKSLSLKMSELPSHMDSRRIHNPKPVVDTLVVESINLENHLEHDLDSEKVHKLVSDSVRDLVHYSVAKLEKRLDDRLETMLQQRNLETLLEKMMEKKIQTLSVSTSELVAVASLGMTWLALGLGTTYCCMRLHH